MKEPKWKSRKVIFGLLLLLTGIAVELISPRGLTQTMAAYLGALGAVYFAGNVGEHFANKGAAVDVAEGDDAAVILTELTSRIVELDTGFKDRAQNADKTISGVTELLTNIGKLVISIKKQNEYIISKAGLGEPPAA